MSVMLLTVEVDADCPAAARTIGENAGFTVKRVSRPTTRNAPTKQTDAFRASATLDRPDGLDMYENKAYLRGYAAACLTFVKANGIPEPGDCREDLFANTRNAEWERHPAAHKKGLAELAAYRLRWGQA